MASTIDKIRSVFGKCLNPGVRILSGILMAAATLLCTSGCDKIMGVDEKEVKQSVVELANELLKKGEFLANSVEAVRAEDLTLVTESLSKRVGYATVVFKSKDGKKTEKIKFDVTVTGSMLDSKQLIEIKMSDESDAMKLVGLAGLDLSDDD